MSDTSRCALALGTVQFGLDYGITNQLGQPSSDVVATILTIAANRGIDLLDTASAYGDSERVLGQLFDHSKEFSVMSKIPNWNGKPPTDCAQRVVSTFETSLKLLNRTQIWGFMVHLARDLVSNQGPEIWRAMTVIKASGRVEKIGISFYADDPIDDLVATFKPDFVQLPLNVIDQQLVANGQLQRLDTAGIEIHARSIFLQGVLLSAVDRLPCHLQNLSPALRSFDATCHEAGLSSLEGALLFARSQPEVSRLIVGVASPDELEAICDAFGAVAHTSPDWQIAGDLSPSLVDPRFWPAS